MNYSGRLETPCLTKCLNSSQALYIYAQLFSVLQMIKDIRCTWGSGGKADISP